MGITIVYSTRKLNEEFKEHIKKTCGYKNIEILAFENPEGTSLTKIYNNALMEKRGLIILVIFGLLVGFSIGYYVPLYQATHAETDKLTYFEGNVCINSGHDLKVYVVETQQQNIKFSYTQIKNLIPKL